jgi:hypothetical protein
VARRNRRRDETPPELRGGAQQGVEEHADGEWVVRQITGSSSVKTYRCPGCDQEIRPATPHVVAWPADRTAGEEERRHWHKACWTARDRRAPRLPRGAGPKH